jgi:hypothetical protein
MFRRRNNRRNRNAGRRFRKRANAGYSETKSWSQAVALTTNILRSDIELSRDRSLTLTGYRVQVCTVNEPGTCQVRIWSPVQQDFVHTSGVRMVPVTGTVITRNFSRIRQVTFPRDFPPSGKILSFDSLCDRSGESSILTVVATLYFRLSPEQLVESCPTTEVAYSRLKAINAVKSTSSPTSGSVLNDFVELSMSSPTTLGENSDTSHVGTSVL